MADQRARIYDFYEYNGITVHNGVLQSSIETLQTFTVRPDDIWVITYPKSGTHWMREIVGLVNSRGIPENIDRTLGGGSCIEMINFRGQTFPVTREDELKNPMDMSPFMDVVEKAPSPRIIHTHLPLHMLPPTLISTAKVLYVARNPKDALNSLYNFYLKTPSYTPWEKMLTSFMDGTLLYGRWQEQVKAFWKIRDERNVLFCTYEDMKKEPLKNVRRVAEFLNASLSEEEIDKVVEHSSFSGMMTSFRKVVDGGDNIAVAGEVFTFMNKGRIGDWKNRFTVAQSEMFDAWYQKEMKDSDISLQFE